jgi:myo-inositol-1(or 4)-monophosphatase
MLEVATDAARRAGAIAAGRYRAGDPGATETKGHAHNLVTETDLLSQKLLVATLTAAFPDHVLIAEEERDDEAGSSADPTVVRWYIDPLDGTNNFAHGLPIFSVTLAAAQGDRLLLGVTYDPLRDELFTALRGQGALRNGRPISVSARPTLDQSVVATGFPYDKSSNPDNNLTELAAVLPQVRGLRRCGSAALDLAWLAAGRFDAYWEGGLSPWDVAAGILLVREAGGRVTDDLGHPATPHSRRIVAGNPHVHPALRETVHAARQAAGFGDLQTPDPRGAT